MRIFETAKNCLARRRSIFYLLDANALLREQFFRLVYCCPPDTGMIPCALNRRFPEEFPSRGTFMQKRFSKAWPLSTGCACLSTTSMSRCC